MARKNMSRRKRSTSHNHTHQRRHRSNSRNRSRQHRSNSRNRSRRHRASSRRRRRRTAGVSYSEELGELEHLKSRIGSLAHMTWGEDEVPDMIRYASINNRAKNNIDGCCDNCREDASTRSSPDCYRRCVQSEIDRVKQIVVNDEARDKIDQFLKKRRPKIIEVSKRRKNRLNTLQKVDARLASKGNRAIIPLDIGKKIATY